MSNEYVYYYDHVYNIPSFFKSKKSTSILRTKNFTLVHSKIHSI